MSRICYVSGKSRIKGHQVSHSQVKTNKFWKPNLRKVRVLENGVAKTIKVSIKYYRFIKEGKIAGLVLNYKGPKVASTKQKTEVKL